MGNQKNVSFLRCVENRKQERLVQGILLFLLKTEDTFKQAFCNWVGWSLFDWIEEESSDAENGRRHDFALHYSDGSKKTIELKLEASLTTNQEISSDDLLIAPSAKLPEIKKCFGDNIKVKSWEDMVENVIDSSDIARVLLSNLCDYYWVPRCFESQQDGEQAFNRILEFLENKSDFLDDFENRISLSNVTTQSSISIVKGYKGFYVYNQKLGLEWRKSLWFGVIADVDKWYKYSEEPPEFDLVLQVFSSETTARLSKDVPLEQLPEYFKYEGNNQGIIIKPSQKQYTIQNTWLQCKDLITRFSELG
jgi:hypothetical protein